VVGPGGAILAVYSDAFVLLRTPHASPAPDFPRCYNYSFNSESNAMAHCWRSCLRYPEKIQLEYSMNPMVKFQLNAVTRYAERRVEYEN